MKKTLSFFIALALGTTAFSQAAYIQPSPTGKNDTITLYINIAQTTDGTQNGGLNAILTDHPEDTVYLWTWQPAGPVIGNGEWTNSNSDMALTKVSDNCTASVLNQPFFTEWMRPPFLPMEFLA
jgi:hypothetical protein